MKLSCTETSPHETRRAYLDLWKVHKKGFDSFSFPDVFFEKLITGDFVFLRNHFTLKTLCLTRSEKPILMATIFLPKRPGASLANLRASIGAFAYAPEIQEEESRYFWNWVQNRYAELDPIGPMNGHYYLGFSLPPDNADGKKIGFQTAAPHRNQRRVFGHFESVPPLRTFHSFETPLNQALVEKIESKIETPPPGIRIRPFRATTARRDLAVMNDLVNKCFTEHFGFVPLTEEENWDISRWSIPLFRRGHFLFIEDSGKPIGFCFGTLDFNQVMRNGSDLGNLGRMLLPGTIPRARMIHKGVLPEYQGQGLVNQARHRILLSFAKSGVKTVENSYVDEGNVKSLSNVRSTGAIPLHNFHLHHLAR